MEKCILVFVMGNFLIMVLIVGFSVLLVKKFGFDFELEYVLKIKKEYKNNYIDNNYVY